MFRVAVVLVSAVAIGCGAKVMAVDGGVGGSGGGLSASSGGAAGATSGGVAGGTSGGVAGGTSGGSGGAAGGASGGASGGTAGGGASGGGSSAPTNCVVGHFTSCASDCEVRLILPGVPATDRYCSMQCDQDAVCLPYGAQLGCSLITGGACTPKCSSHSQCRDAGFGYCDLDGGTCDTYANCSTNTECTALGFRGCDTQLGLCY